MLKTIQRMLLWCAPFKKRLYLGFSCRLSIHFCSHSDYFSRLCHESDARAYAWEANDFDYPFYDPFAGLIVSVLGRYGCTYLRAVLQDMIAYEITAEKG